MSCDVGPSEDPGHSMEDPEDLVALQDEDLGLEARREGGAWRVIASRSYDAEEVVERCEALELCGGANGSSALPVLLARSAALRGIIVEARGEGAAAVRPCERVVPMGFGSLYRRVPPESATLMVTVTTTSAASTVGPIVLRASRDLPRGAELTLPSPCVAEVSERAEDVARAFENHCLGTVRYSSIHGRGVFASHSISCGVQVHTCPTVELDKSGQCVLSDYCMTVESDAGSSEPIVMTYPPRPVEEPCQSKEPTVVLALGCGALFNHSKDPNVNWEYLPSGLMSFTACRDITANEEMLISYGSAYWAARSRESIPDFGSGNAYWDAQYEGRVQPESWLLGYAELREILDTAAGGDLRCRILHVGCGTCGCTEALYDAGYRNILNVDKSPAAIEHMLDRNEELRPEMRWLVEDATSFSPGEDFGDGSYGLIFEKGFIDTLLCEGVAALRAFLTEAKRLLRPDGVLLCVSLNDEASIREHLDGDNLGLTVSVTAVPTPYGSSVNVWFCRPSAV